MSMMALRVIPSRMPASIIESPRTRSPNRSPRLGTMSGVTMMTSLGKSVCVADHAGSLAPM